MNILSQMTFDLNSHQLDLSKVVPETLNRVSYSQKLKTNLEESRLTQKWSKVLQRLVKLNCFKIWLEQAQQRLEKIPQQLESKTQASIQENREEDYELLLIQLSLDAVEDLDEV